MSKKPFFSIPIATYNRSGELDFAIQRILAQSWVDFELIISDDNSTDSTQAIVLRYKDKRIRYYKNTKNLGAVKNIGKVLSYVKGEYIFLHGDDDYLLYDRVLEDTAKLLRTKKVGLVRHNYLYQSFDKKSVFDFFRNKFTTSDLSLTAKEKPIKILEFMEKIDLYFISGIIFKNMEKHIRILDSELIPWFAQCYTALSHHGGIYSSTYAIIASWSNQKRNPVYFVENGKLPWEELYNAMKRVAQGNFYRTALKRQLEISVNFLTIIKYNSSNRNIILYAKRILQLEPLYNTSIKFWVSLALAFILPKFVLRCIRSLYIFVTKQFGKTQNHEDIIQRIKTIRGFHK